MKRLTMMATRCSTCDAVYYPPCKSTFARAAADKTRFDGRQVASNERVFPNISRHLPPPPFPKCFWAAAMIRFLGVISRWFRSSCMQLIDLISMEIPVLNWLYRSQISVL